MLIINIPICIIKAARK